MLAADDSVRPAYRQLDEWLKSKPDNFLRRKSRDAEVLFRRLGITFAVYGGKQTSERLIPFDVIPRIIAADEWRRLERGIRQRVSALNAFLYDVYHDQEIIRAGRVPAELITSNAAFLPEMIGHNPALNVYAHIVGTDMVRTGENEFYVLEDNARTPSGVSYMLENRETMMHLFPDLFAAHRVAPVDQYTDLLLETMIKVAPQGLDGDPNLAVLTPGVHNSAYFEHAFLADQMGVELVEGGDLQVKDGYLYMHTTQGDKRVDVVYRRIDDDYLDPLTFRPDSMLGVAGIFDVYRAGRVTIINAPGSGIADDKAIYSYMPDIIEFYTGEQPLLNNVPTYRCNDNQQLSYVLDNLNQLVVKEVHGSGGYGMLIGPAASSRELREFTSKLKQTPEAYIAQPTLALSACPALVKSGIAPRHVDLRPFVLVSDDIRITPGGLTRVAMREGSLVVNSSQGGGTKDTWVLED